MENHISNEIKEQDHLYNHHLQNYELEEPFYSSTVKNFLKKGRDMNKVDLSEVSLISGAGWKMLKEERKKNRKKYFPIERKEKLKYLLSSDQQFEHILQKLKNPTYFPHLGYWEDRLHLEIHKAQLATEFLDSMDDYTFLLFNKMVRHEILLDVNKIVHFNGGRSIILHGTPHPNNSEVKEGELALKVFKKTTAAAKLDWGSVVPEITVSQKSKTEIINLAEKEFLNLQKVWNSGIKCPKPLALFPALKKHILLMPFIGKDKMPAPKLKDMCSELCDYAEAYKQLISAMRTLYHKAKLIHTDLLENTLWHNQQCYFVGFSDVIDVKDEGANEILKENCLKITWFFLHMNTDGLLLEEDLYKFIISEESSDHVTSNNVSSTIKLWNYNLIT